MGIQNSIPIHAIEALTGETRQMALASVDLLRLVLIIDETSRIIMAGWGSDVLNHGHHLGSSTPWDPLGPCWTIARLPRGEHANNVLSSHTD